MVVGFGGLLEVVVIISRGFDGEREREKYELLFILYYYLIEYFILF